MRQVGLVRDGDGVDLEAGRWSSDLAGYGHCVLFVRKRSLCGEMPTRCYLSRGRTRVECAMSGGSVGEMRRGKTRYEAARLWQIIQIISRLVRPTARLCKGGLTVQYLFASVVEDGELERDKYQNVAHKIERKEEGRT